MQLRTEEALVISTCALGEKCSEAFMRLRKKLYKESALPLLVSTFFERALGKLRTGR